MKPNSKRGAWRAETALARLRRCLAFLRTGDFLSPSEQTRILKRVNKWKAKHELRPLIKRKPQKEPKLSAMRDTIEERFNAFHAANPSIYQHLVKLTKERFLRGSTKYGLKAMWEQLRWHIATGNLNVVGPYYLNNDFTSRYVRLLLAEYPAYRGLFDLRHLRTP